MGRFAVIGLGRFGARLARLLAAGGAEVIAVDSRRDLVEALRDDVDRAVCLDATDEEALKAQAIDQVDVAVVGIGTQFEAAVLSTVLLKRLNVPRVIARAASGMRAQVLSGVGADDIVNPEREAAERWSNRLLAPSILEQITLAEGYSVAQLEAPPSFHGKTLRDLAILNRYKVNVIAIRRQKEAAEDGGGPHEVITVPMADTTIQPGDVLLLIGSDAAIADFPKE